jgi:hypothetical protein
MSSVLRTFASLLGGAAFMFAYFPSYAAVEVEPNDSCQAAQVIRKGVSTITGTANTGNVDFFRVRGAPGSTVQINLNGQDIPATPEPPLSDPFLGVFDSACNLLATNDDSNSLNSQLRVLVPPDGTFVIAATSCCDYTFTTGGTSLGDYVVNWQTYVPPAAIKGTVQRPDGTAASYSSVSLIACPSAEYELCNNTVTNINSDIEGNYSIVLDTLPAGSYQIVASEYSAPAKRSKTFSYAPDGQAVTVNIRLAPPAVSIANVIWNTSDVPKGGTVDLLFNLTNNTRANGTVTYWLVASASPTGSQLGSSVFQVGPNGMSTPGSVSMASGQTASVVLPFSVPQSSLSGSSGTLTLFVASGNDQANTVARYDYLYYYVTPAGTLRFEFGDTARERIERDAQRRISPLGLKKKAS